MPDPAPLPRLPFSRPTISEACIAEVAEVLRSGWITSGPRVARFEQDFAAATGARHAIAVNSATSGLDLVFAAMDLAPGDEVITPSINWVSGPNMVELNGGINVFCEVDPATLNLDLDHVERLISERTRAIMPVHFAGAPVDLDRLRAIAAPRGIAIIEDAAHAAGGAHRGAPIGGDSHVAVFSFHPTKNLTTAEGGMITCRDDALAERLRLLRFHGIRKDAWKNHARSGKDLYQVISPSRKSNLPDTLAVLGIHQLRELAALNAERARLAGLYHQRMRGLRIAAPLQARLEPGDIHAWHVFIVLLAPGVDRARVVDRLEALGIGTALHFPPVHAQEYYRARHPGLSLPVSEDVGARLLTIPLFPGMGDAAVDRVVDAFRALEREILP